MWSLGVMAFELLTGRPAMSMVGKDKVGVSICKVSSLVCRSVPCIVPYLFQASLFQVCGHWLIEMGIRRQSHHATCGMKQKNNSF